MAFSDAVNQLFSNYLAGFSRYELERVMRCYLPYCTLSTPDELKVIDDQALLADTLNGIFDQLKAHQVASIDITNASFDRLAENSAIACVHWQFIDVNNTTFADFCAFYHIERQQSGALGFRHVISHTTEQHKKFPIPISIEVNN